MLYRAGVIKDYDTFPAGRLVMGIAKPNGKHSHMPVTRDAALGWFHDLEVIAGVQVVKGRGWNGLRRILMDAAPKYTGNEATLNTLSGTSTAMRNEVYQDRESLESKVDAANTCERIRTNGRTAGTTPAPNPLRINPELAKQLSRYSADEIRAMIAQMEADRAARSSAAVGTASGTGSEQNGGSVDPAVDPDEEARGSTTWARASGVPIERLTRSGRPDSNRRRPAWEGDRSTDSHLTPPRYSTPTRPDNPLQNGRSGQKNGRGGPSVDPARSRTAFCVGWSHRHHRTRRVRRCFREVGRRIMSTACRVAAETGHRGV